MKKLIQKTHRMAQISANDLSPEVVRLLDNAHGFVDGDGHREKIVSTDIFNGLLTEINISLKTVKKLKFPTHITEQVKRDLISLIKKVEKHQFIILTD
jgi:hypothetical protein